MELENQKMLDQNIRENTFTRFGVKRPHTVFVMICVTLILGIFAFTTLRIELFPNMNLPFAIVMITPEDSSPRAMFHPDGTPNNEEFLEDGVTPNPNRFNPALLDPETVFHLTERIEVELGRVNGISQVQTMTSGMILGAFVELHSNVRIAEVMPFMMEAMNRINFQADHFNNAQIIPLDPNMMPIFTFSSTFMLPEEDFMVHNGTEYVLDQDARLEATRRWYRTTLHGALFAANGVGDVSMSLGGDNSFSYFNGEISFSVSVFMRSGAVITEVAQEIENVLADFGESHGFHYEPLTNQGADIMTQINSIMNNLIIGGILAIIILFLFLRNIKLTIAVAIAIPLSVIGTFVLMYFMGITINIVSLAGLALAIGMLIDNSIIVIENIYRLRAKGMPIKQAAIKGASQILGAMIAATLTTIAVFVPMFFVTGLMMEVFMDMVYVIVFALLVSLIVAVMFLPAIISAFRISCKNMKSKYAKSDDDKASLQDALALEAEEKKLQNRGFFARMFDGIGRGWSKITAPIANAWNKFLAAIRWAAFTAWVGRAFEGTVRWTIRFKFVVVPIVIAMFVGSIFLATTHGFEMMPAQDMGSFSVTMSTNQGLLITDQQRLDAARKLAMDDDDGIYALIRETLGGDAENISVSFGGGGAFSTLLGGSSNININVTLRENRNITTTGASQMVQDAIEEFLDYNAGDDLLVIPGPMPNVTFGDFVTNVSIGSGMDMMAASEIVQVIAIEPREDETLTQASARLGLAINATVLAMREVQGVHRVTTDFNPMMIARVDRMMGATVTGTIVDGQNIGIVQGRWDDRFDELQNDALTAEYFEGMRPIPDGFAAQMEDTMNQMIIAILVGLLLMYLVMVAIFRSFKSPIIILITVPLAFTGAFLLLAMAGMPLSIVALIGLLVLMGVVVNNGIVFIDYINQARRDGLSRNEAIVAAAKTRARPIMMMALTTILAMLPMALGFGGGAEMMQPVAIVTVGGLAYATALTLLVIPAFYSIFNWLPRSERQKLKEERQAKKQAKLAQPE
ncbi:MAG: efflux RND transporter permease subunit [Firmicutes bacterium]|nr:efflux RND transporter permease subunit [Bacillota bacterium]